MLSKLYHGVCAVCAFFAVSFAVSYDVDQDRPFHCVWAVLGSLVQSDVQKSISRILAKSAFWSRLQNVHELENYCPRTNRIAY